MNFGITLLLVGFVIAIIGIVFKGKERRPVVAWTVGILLTANLLIGIVHETRKTQLAQEEKRDAEEQARQLKQFQEKSDRLAGLLAGLAGHADATNAREILAALYDSALTAARTEAGAPRRWKMMAQSANFVKTREEVPEAHLAGLRMADRSLSEPRRGWMFIGENPVEQNQPVANIERETKGSFLRMRDVLVAQRYRASTNIFLHSDLPIDDDRPAPAVGIVLSGQIFRVLEKAAGIPSAHSPSKSFWIKVETTVGGAPGQ